MYSTNNVSPSHIIVNPTINFMVKSTIILIILKFHEEKKKKERKEKKKVVGIEILDPFLLGEFALCL